MRRLAAGLALILGAALAVSAPAQAVSRPDPVKTLAAQYAPGKGVGISIVTSLRLKPHKPVKKAKDADITVMIREKGVLAFGPRGLVASDLTQSAGVAKADRHKLSKQARELLDTRPGRAIHVDGMGYSSEPPYPYEFPVGKSWLRDSYGRPGPILLTLNALEPRTLKTLLDGASSHRDGVARGTITTTKLVRVSPSGVDTYGSGRSRYGGVGKITYTIRFDSRGLVERVGTKVILPSDEFSFVLDSQIRYTGWGGQVTVYAPPAEEVMDREDFPGYDSDDIIWEQPSLPLNVLKPESGW
ncbi:hypothetical protein HNP84_001698 [Thermocatellispora tengchongensis]|uniref:DUF2092 domain-containing protein n=1 Tax=Thermocatellispora tengchongensis TaxID=1073253 RepID=A0A840P7J5_9ACTN|nr:hypothetical protein [Thermocatellispora tengchongensis]MBB5131985.1 hypothetical protein [Thermocatellispora tengchongensis]